MDRAGGARALAPKGVPEAGNKDAFSQPNSVTARHPTRGEGAAGLSYSGRGGTVIQSSCHTAALSYSRAVIQRQCEAIVRQCVAIVRRSDCHTVALCGISVCEVKRLALVAIFHFASLLTKSFGAVSLRHCEIPEN